MFGGKSCILRGGSVSLALVILIFLMLTLLVSEENPLRASLFDAQRQFSASPPPPPPPPSFSGTFNAFPSFSIQFLFCFVQSCSLVL